MLEQDPTLEKKEEHVEDLRTTISNAMKEVAAKEDSVATTNESTTQAPRNRDEAGKYAPETAARTVDAVPAQTATPQAPAPQAESQTQAPLEPAAITPPRGWSPASKVAFDNLPDHLKSDIVRRETEINQGFAKYSGLDRHVQEFEAVGVRLPDAIAAYRRAEEMLGADFPSGIENLCEQFQVHPVQLAQSILQKYGQGEQQQYEQQGGIDPQLANYIGQLEQRLNSIETTNSTQARSVVETDINKFISDPSNKFVDNVVDQMSDIITMSKQKGIPISLKDAYDAACWQNPETRQLLIDEQLTAKSKSAVEKASKAASQARAAAASVTGSPIHGVSPEGGSSRSLRDDIKQAFDASAGRV